MSRFNKENSVSSNDPHDFTGNMQSADEMSSTKGELFQREFYSDGSEQPLYSITDDAGRVFASWNLEGEFDVEPSQSLAEKVKCISGEFHTEDDQPSYAWIDQNGVVFYGVDDQGRNIIGGDSDGISKTEGGASPNGLYDNFGSVFVKRNYDNPHIANGREFFPSTNSVYAAYDDLIVGNSDYISKEVVSILSDGSTIYAYKFTPPSFFNSANAFPEHQAPPRIVICTGLHGDEQSAILTVFSLMNDVVKNWISCDLLAGIRWTTEVVIIPVCCPYGVDNNTRYNHNGVDLNRNFPEGWNENESNSGSSAGSEEETQVCMTIPNIYPNAFVYIDAHAHVSSKFTTWLSFNNAEEQTVCRESARFLDAVLKREFEFFRNEGNKSRVRLTGFAGGRMRTYWGENYGVTAHLWERTKLASAFFPGATWLDVNRYSLYALMQIIKTWSKEKGVIK